MNGFLKHKLKSFFAVQIEVEEIATTQPRYRPNSLKGLCQGTRFTEAELKHIYRNLKGECPSGVINEEAFKNIYSKFFPNGGEHLLIIVPPPFPPSRGINCNLPINSKNEKKLPVKYAATRISR